MPSARLPRRPVVAFGASAGGLEALLEVLPALRPNGRTRYLLAQHMARTGHTDLVVRVLSRKAALPVVEATSGMLVTPDVIHVIPAGFDGLFDDGRIHLRTPPEGSHSIPSVNLLFESVARSAGSDAYAVVLSGAGSDGRVGCREVRAHGGTVVVQEEATTSIHGMAGAVEREGLADHCLTPAGIAALLNSLVPAVREVPRLVQHPYSGSPEMEELLLTLSNRSGVDFTMYRQGTLLRRMERRCSDLRLPDLSAYIHYAMTQPGELDALQRHFLISWSWLFRDREAWDRLRTFIAQQLAGKPADEPYRAWVPGCASGEEPYTIAMLLSDLAPGHPFEVVGSDLNPEAIELARNARYRDTSLRELPSGFLERFTAGTDDRRRIIDPLRQACVFREEDVLTSQPPGPFDLVSCRNLLIYMKRELQTRVLGAAHQLLRPGGLLFLGMSEGLGQQESSQFDTVDSTHRIYRRRSTP